MKRIMAICAALAAVAALNSAALADTVNLVTILPQPVAAFVKLEVAGNSNFTKVNMGKSGTTSTVQTKQADIYVPNVIVGQIIKAKEADITVNTSALDFGEAEADNIDVLDGTVTSNNFAITADNSLYINGVKWAAPSTGNINWNEVKVGEVTSGIKAVTDGTITSLE
ncbi:hypothetical protein AAIR98_001245 [Elusimicrobium simillimum]|uniref:hypothetical protein n=1 Tax=Elusimicrobium simillimum TaxID=3143438 RepID=UPI003C70430E